MRLRRARRKLYRAGGVLGDVDAVLHPSKAARRVENKILGRTVIRRLWRR